MARLPSRRSVELYSAVILSLAALATSWGGYQSTLWNGTQARQAILANAMRTCATRATNAAGQARTIDVVVFASWLAATAAGEERLATFYEERARPEFASAFHAWLATQPRTNPHAPANPFVMSEYLLASDTEARRCDREASRASAASQHANQVGDNYMLATVIFAVVLFFAGGVSNARSRDLQLVLLVISLLAIAAGFAHILRLPRGGS
jgi:hypothetical protein